MKTRYSKLLILVLLPILIGSCKKYLDVAPKSSISENEMFSSEAGFLQALNGIYSTLASRSLYGDNLSMGFVSALAQNYATSGTSSSALFVPTRNYEYQSSQVVNYTNTIWKDAYSAIAGVNNILKFSETNRQVLSESSYRQIRGESLALRALLHFELLRLFAPSYQSNPTGVGIPYRISVDQFSVRPSNVGEVLDFTIKDLTDAAPLLRDSDPIFNNTMERQFRLNYYAVRGILARVHLYKGNSSEAYTSAKEVVDSDVFPYVNPATVSAPAATRNRLFRSELVFALRNRNIVTWAEDEYFKFFANSTYRLTRPESDLRLIYEVGANNDTDLRWVNLFEDDQGFIFPSKFWQTATGATDSLRLDRMVPVLRISEMRYILAETAVTPQEALTHLNSVRKARNVPEIPANVNTLTRTYIQDEITKEYQKEFYAEGQLFFYYKRLNFTQIQFQVEAFNPKVYVLPLPQDELEFNPNY